MSTAKQSAVVPGRQARNFIVIGVGTVMLDYATLYLLTAYGGVTYLISAAVAFMLASTCNYLLSIRWVFVPGKFSPPLEFGMFIGTSSVGLVINQLAMWVLVEFIGIGYLMAKPISIVLVTIWNFVSKKKLVFVD